MTYDSMGKSASTHLIEYTRAKYFEKGIILPYCR